MNKTVYVVQNNSTNKSYQDWIISENQYSNKRWIEETIHKIIVNHKSNQTITETRVIIYVNNKVKEYQENLKQYKKAIFKKLKT